MLPVRSQICHFISLGVSCCILTAPKFRSTLRVAGSLIHHRMLQLHPEGGRSGPQGSHRPQFPGKIRQQHSFGHFTSLETCLFIRTSLVPQASFPLVNEVLSFPACGTLCWSLLISLFQGLTPLPLPWAYTNSDFILPLIPGNIKEQQITQGRNLG